MTFPGCLIIGIAVILQSDQLKSPGSLFQNGIEALRRKEYSVAEESFHSAKLGAEHHRMTQSLVMAGALHGLAHTRKATFRYDDAIELLKRECGILHRLEGRYSPKYVSTLNELGALYLARGMLRAAKNAWTYALATIGDTDTYGNERASVLLHLALVCARLGETKQAQCHIDECNRILARSMPRPSHLVMVCDYTAGIIMSMVGRHDEAISEFKRAVDRLGDPELAPLRGPALTEWAYASLRSGRLDRARQLIGESTQAFVGQEAPDSPNLFRLRLCRIRLCIHEREFDTAIRLLSELERSCQDKWKHQALLLQCYECRCELLGALGKRDEQVAVAAQTAAMRLTLDRLEEREIASCGSAPDSIHAIAARVNHQWDAAKLLNEERTILWRKSAGRLFYRDVPVSYTAEEWLHPVRGYRIILMLTSAELKQASDEVYTVSAGWLSVNGKRVEQKGAMLVEQRRLHDALACSWSYIGSNLHTGMQSGSFLELSQRPTVCLSSDRTAAEPFRIYIDRNTNVVRSIVRSRTMGTSASVLEEIECSGFLKVDSVLAPSTFRVFRDGVLHREGKVTEIGILDHRKWDEIIRGGGAEK